MEEAARLSVDIGSNISVSRQLGLRGPVDATRSRRLYPAVKRAVDITVSLTALVVLALAGSLGLGLVVLEGSTAALGRRAFRKIKPV